MKGIMYVRESRCARKCSRIHKEISEALDPLMYKWNETLIGGISSAVLRAHHIGSVTQKDDQDRGISRGRREDLLPSRLGED